MSETYNIYCDESAHLLRDHQPLMVLGAVWCPQDKVPEIMARLRQIKRRHQLPPLFEVKWSKVSPAKVDFYRDLIDDFFDDADLYFRALIVPDKSLLDHDHFQQDHDTWYYKMYFQMLSVLLHPENRYEIYLDIKDTRSASKVRHLHDILCRNLNDHNQAIVTRVQTVRSHEVPLIQIADLLIGIVSYANRRATTSQAKIELVKHVQEHWGNPLTLTTTAQEKKINLFHWKAQAISS